MPSWYALGHRARRDLIAYIQTFSPRWKTEQPKAPIVIPSEPPSSPESLGRGKEVYEQTGCANCHGERGLGDGPSAKAGLQDSWGNPIAPANLANAHSKYGDNNADLYRILMTGIDGTPMPSFGEVLTADQAWDLVHYLQILSRETPSPDGSFAALSAHRESIPTILGFLFGE
jgi:mono/diheme cytochrome c family protein